MTQLNTNELARYWLRSAEEAWTTAQWLVKGKRYSESLFFCQLSLEKLLKGLVVLRTQQASPHLHDLVRLANIAELNPTTVQVHGLAVISGFSIKARYDDEKETFRKQATPAYARTYFDATETLRVWLRKKYPPEFIV